ncbi:ankyrin repeat and SOCS box protein 5-like isoform X1 [Asterias amurensis]|uniref:ankyrin repeat and SOCS box protein 5-like isoform X1 n=1 Tax=Asterias amurensis TaxID=7602 RepID=UPI003AB8FD36
MSWTRGQNLYIRNHENDGRVTLGHDRSRLHQAATMGQLLMLHALIEDGAKVNVTTYNGVTPLHDACSTGHQYSARCLIKAGGKLNPMDIDWHTPLTRACSERHKDCVDLLIRSGAKLNIENEMFSPLHCAAAAGCIDSTNLLLQAGAEVDKLDYNRSGTPLHAAANGHQTACAKALLQAGADINSARPTDNKTPLHVAASVSAPAEMITLLLQHGAKIHDLDTEGKKAVDLAPMDSQAYGVLKEHTENAGLLSELCRECIHQHLILDESVNSLPLPERLKEFLQFKS